jgi:hypothetical protein
MHVTKRLIVAGAMALLLLLVGGTAMADRTQVDIGLNVPYRVGISSEEAGDIGAFVDYAFLLPDVRIQWYWEAGPIKLGPGVRLWTLILESVAYPILSVEAEIGPIVLNANVGGGAFLFFGLYNDLGTGRVLFPEISAAFKLGESFSIGTGAMILFVPELADEEIYPYIGTIFVRFTL